MAAAGLDVGSVAWVLVSSAMVLLMTPGLAFFYGGLVRGSNVLNTMMMSVFSMGVIALVWFAVGFSLAFGSGGGSVIGDFKYIGFAGLEGEMWQGGALPSLLFAVFQMTFAIISAAIISGAIVERMRFFAYLAFIVLWSLLVYAPVCHWVWGPGGWIEGMGAQDFAGGLVVHECTAVSALVLAMLLGPRDGFHDGERVPPHNVPFVILGAALLWFGWSGFNGGSALAADEVAVLAVVNTNLAAATSLVVWAIVERWHNGHTSAVGTVTGAIVGLVVITPAAAYVSPLGAVIMSAIACGLVYPTFQLSHARIDDSLDAFPCHGVSGFLGSVLLGFFAKDGGVFYHGGATLLWKQVVAASAVCGYSAAVSAGIYLLLSLVMRMRATKDEEGGGLDFAVHGERAYCGDKPTTRDARDLEVADQGAGEAEARP